MLHHVHYLQCWDFNQPPIHQHYTNSCSLSSILRRFLANIQYFNILPVYVHYLQCWGICQPAMNTSIPDQNIPTQYGHWYLIHCMSLQYKHSLFFKEHFQNLCNWHIKVKVLVVIFGMTLVLIEYYNLAINVQGINDQNCHITWKIIIPRT